MSLMVAMPAASGDAYADVKTYLQKAIELEHATIPPYLTAMYSLAPGRNDAIGALIRSVVVQEMAHMTLAANILSAIGGTPRFTDESFIPSYPGGLPYHIGGAPFEVPLAPFSLDLVKNIFMVIELPEGPPLEFPVTPPPALAAFARQDDREFKTIGAFYEFVKETLEEAGPDIYTGDPAKQLTHPYGAFRVESLDDAKRAIDEIVRQGEGSHESPLSGPAGELAHYYRFAEIVKGRTLIGDPTQPKPPYYSYSGIPLTFDPLGVIPIVTNAKQAMYGAGTPAARFSHEFNGMYGNLLRMLEESYAGHDVTANIIGCMFQMKILAKRLMSTQLPSPPYGTLFAAPTFEFVGTHAAF